MAALIRMYGNAYGWSRQSWSVDPARIASAQYQPFDSQPEIFQRDLLGSDQYMSLEEYNDPAGVCNADL
ncbi:Glycoside hydrolase superfamily [Penicillium tannophilum]|nr:Glycoside hydrolase superfamily [Penicillium tannophilum]